MRNENGINKDGRQSTEIKTGGQEHEDEEKQKSRRLKLALTIGVIAITAAGGWFGWRQGVKDNVAAIETSQEYNPSNNSNPNEEINIPDSDKVEVENNEETTESETSSNNSEFGEDNNQADTNYSEPDSYPDDEYYEEMLRQRDVPPTNMTVEEFQAMKAKEAEGVDPIIHNLPHSTLTYEITAVGEKGTAGNKQTLNIHILLFEADRRTGEEAAIKKYKQEALDWMRSVGCDPSDYNIIYEY